MKRELTSIDKMIIIDEMLTKLGYDTGNMRLSEALEIKNTIDRLAREGHLPLKK